MRRFFSLFAVSPDFEVMTVKYERSFTRPREMFEPATNAELEVLNSPTKWQVRNPSQIEPPASAFGSRTRRATSSAIAELSEIEREVVVLRFVEDLSIEEIATTCSLPIGTVKSHLHRAKQDLKRILTEAEISDE